MGKYVVGIIVAVVGAVIAGALWLGGSHIILFHPAGYISTQEVSLMGLALRLMLLVAIPVFALTFFMAWHYREGNTRARYLPNWDHNVIEELVWWLVPIVIIVVLAGVTWTTTHTLDPYRPITATSTTPMTVQVVALDWRWLFIYPAQGIATVNYLEIPANTPIDFELTADAPMNALWIPQLGGQEMAMPGMETHLHLMADKTGEYRGLSSNFSGAGFAGMHFPVYAVSPDTFQAWVRDTQAATTTLPTLTKASYRALAKPNTDGTAQFYLLGDPNLYTEIVNSFMKPAASATR